jgi:hypothetical protein
MRSLAFLMRWPLRRASVRHARTGTAKEANIAAATGGTAETIAVTGARGAASIAAAANGVNIVAAAAAGIAEVEAADAADVGVAAEAGVAVAAVIATGDKRVGTMQGVPSVGEPSCSSVRFVRLAHRLASSDHRTTRRVPFGGDFSCGWPRSCSVWA